jgi:tRNA threonylcarbamoyl adenosine modification protein YeaZ
MKILFLDLASNSASDNEGACIACVSDKKTESIVFADHRMPDDRLLPTLEKALKQAGWADRDLTHVACVTGPGGFTSLRVAVTLGNTYSDQLQIPVAGVHLSDVYCARVGAQHAAPLLWMHSTKKTQLFVRSFGNDQWPEPTLISVEDLAMQLPKGASVIGEILPEHREAIAVRNPSYPLLKPIADVLPVFLTNLRYDQAPLAPWYGRGW